MDTESDVIEYEGEVVVLQDGEGARYVLPKPLIEQFKATPEMEETLDAEPEEADVSGFNWSQFQVSSMWWSSASRFISVGGGNFTGGGYR